MLSYNHMHTWSITTHILKHKKNINLYIRNLFLNNLDPSPFFACTPNFCHTSLTLVVVVVVVVVVKFVIWRFFLCIIFLTIYHIVKPLHYKDKKGHDNNSPRTPSNISFPVPILILARNKKNANKITTYFLEKRT